jgi:hypothetical protein
MTAAVIFFRKTCVLAKGFPTSKVTFNVFLYSGLSVAEQLQQSVCIMLLSLHLPDIALEALAQIRDHHYKTSSSRLFLFVFLGPFFYIKKVSNRKP